MPPNDPTWADLTSDYVMRPKRPTPRHRAENRRWATSRARAATALTAIATAPHAARDAFTAALVGTGTPAGGLTLHRHDRRAS